VISLNFFLTLTATFIFLLIFLLIFIRTGSPVYRLEKKNVVELLELVLDGSATNNDWEVFLGLPIRHNEVLETVRLRCQTINNNEQVDNSTFLLTEKGVGEIKKLLIELLGMDP